MDGQQFFKLEEFQQIEKQSPFGWRGMVGLSVPEWRPEHFALQAWMRVISTTPGDAGLNIVKELLEGKVVMYYFCSFIVFFNFAVV